MKQQSLMSFFTNKDSKKGTANDKSSNEENLNTSASSKEKKENLFEIDKPAALKETSNIIKSEFVKEKSDESMEIISDQDSPIKQTVAKKRKLKVNSVSSGESDVDSKKSVSKATTIKKTTFSDESDSDASIKVTKSTKKKSETIKKSIKTESNSEEEKESPKKKSPVKKSDFFAKKEKKEIKVESTIEADKSPNTAVKKSDLFTKKEIKIENIPLVEESTDGILNVDSLINTNEYLPGKDKYHPVKDACWKKGESVPYMALSRTFFCMEETSKRLELISILCNYFRSVILLSPNDLVASMYLCLNKVSPDYEGLELGIGDTILFKALAQATGRTLDKLKAELRVKGDIGLVAEANRCNQKLIFTPKKLTVAIVFNKLKEISSLSGNSSQSKKCDLIKHLLVSCDSIEARYLLRSLSGKLRIGIAEQSALTSLANACCITPPLIDENKVVIDYFKANKIHTEDAKKQLEEYSKLVKQTYYQCPNYEIIISTILKFGLDELPNNCKLTPGIPLKPMLAYPTTGVNEILKRFEGIEFTCEYKYDGERAQIHILSNGSVNIYSRNSENNTSKYPDLIKVIQELIKENASKNPEDGVTTAIVDAEVVAFDTKNKVILPFQILSTRKRKDAVESDIKIEVCVFAFDLIFINGKSLIDEPLRKRRELLAKHFPHTENKFMYAINMNSNDLEQIQEFLEKSVKDGCEGLMVKTLTVDAHYEISKRSHNWLKLKKDYLEGVGDTLDLLVIGGYIGAGKRTGTYGGYLLAVYDEDNEEYQTICKIGTGFKDDDLTTQFESLSKIKIDKPKPYYRVDESLKPDDWFDADQVWEVKCADFSLSPIHTAAKGLIESNKGISLRFPRFLKLREDKKPEDCTTSKQLAEMYKSQQQMINQTDDKKKKNLDEDEDY